MWIAMAAIACVTRVEWFHKLLALFAVAMNAAYIGLLFSRLQ
jgi:hypothetical protein